jgi:hypothetical protein
MQKFGKNNQIQKKQRTRHRASLLNAAVMLYFVILFLICGNNTSAQYGSLGQHTNVSSGTLLNNTQFGNAQSILVAQAVPVPAAVMPSAVPSAIPAAIPAAAPVFVQPLDPYSVPRTSSLFTSASVPGTVPVNTANNTPAVSTSPTSTLYPAPVYSGQWNQVMPETYQAIRRFREATEFSYTMIPAGGKKDGNKSAFGISEIDMRMQLSFPCRFIPHYSPANTESTEFFYVAPGLSVLWWDGPNGPPDMSPNGFGAYVDFGVNPRFNEVFAMDGWFRLGVYSDFKKVTSDALRFQGRLTGVFTVSPEVQIVGGVQYLDRVRLKIIPVGGVIWTPKDDLVLRLTFPNPKISKRFWKTGSADWWGYIAADYGGNSWSINGIGQTDYNDIRVGLGIEFETLTKINGHVEFGGAFGRELYSKNAQWEKLSDAVYLKLGIVF